MQENKKQENIKSSKLRYFFVGILVIIFIICIIMIVTKVKDKINSNNLEPITKISSTQELLVEFENKLTDSNIEFEKKKINAVLFGANQGYEYELATDEIIQIYTFEQNSEEVKAAKSTKKLTVKNSNESISVIVNSDNNLALYMSKENKVIKNIFMGL